jgi:MFS-type transporter involved in bile tolerance (Atg22 family)
VGEASTDRKAVWGWALYDFGNSAFFTVIVDRKSVV